MTMKRILTFMLVVLAGMSVAMAQRSNHFTVDLNFNKTIKGGDGYTDKALNAWGISATGGYRFYVVKGFYITPEVTLYYENHKHEHIYSYIGADGKPADGPVYGGPDNGSYVLADGRDRTSEAGIGLGGMLGYNLVCSDVRSIDIFTGPYFDCAFVQKDDLINHPSFKWRFGAAFSFSRFYIKGSFDLALTNLTDGIGEANMVNAGIGYHF